jgi:hypothetical protein
MKKAGREKYRKIEERKGMQREMEAERNTYSNITID